MKILIAGELNVDLILQNYHSFPQPGREVLVEDMSLTLGSASAICAAGLAKLGNSVSFAGKVGCDPWGDFVMDTLAALGIDLAYVLRDPDVKTGLTVSITSARDRALVTYLGSIAALRANDIEDSWFRGFRHLHAGSFFLQQAFRPGVKSLLARAHRAGLTTSIDPGCDPSGSWGADLLDALEEADFFFPNEVELQGVTGLADPVAALRALDNGHTRSIAKIGGRGCMTLVDGRPLHLPAFRVESVDTTGAGDSFNAGFLHAWLAGRDIIDSMRFGAACGALSTQSMGGTAAQPDMRRAEDFLAAQSAELAGVGHQGRKMKPNRRQWFKTLGAGAVAGALPGNESEATPLPPAGQPLDLTQYQPRSMLRVKETKVARPRYPVIDVHTHLSWTTKSTGGVSVAGERVFIWPAARVLETMDRKGLRTMVNLTGGFGAGLEEAIGKFDRAHPGRFYTFTEPSYNRFLEPDYPKLQSDAIAQAHRSGARGLKILKTLGLYLRENISTGRLVQIDDPRFDPMWDACGQLNMPVAIHISDPAAFFTPTDRFNERFEELNQHPDWSFSRPGYPTNEELLAARNRVFARHPKTQFLALHVGNHAEDLDNVSEALDRFPNMSVEIAARVGELGRQPRRARAFFDRYQDRILFGTDAVPDGKETPQQLFVDELYEIYYRFLETDDEYFDYAPAPVPPQGRWRIYGLNLPDAILRKVYNQNATRLLGITA